MSVDRPPKPEEEDQELISYRQYLDIMYPLKRKEEVADAQERNRLNAENETIRLNKITNFAKPGNPGVKFKNVFEKMIKSLTLPKAAKEELGISEDIGGQVIS
mmetsp:Transcript_25410/g.19147  ORF Transcript_25410/g.19147 Transcript_25410/m.19147 type:complete len:103 (+) Transcript_25410:211-519(+)